MKWYSMLLLFPATSILPNRRNNIFIHHCLLLLLFLSVRKSWGNVTNSKNVLLREVNKCLQFHSPIQQTCVEIFGEMNGGEQNSVVYKGKRFIHFDQKFQQVAVE